MERRGRGPKSQGEWWYPEGSKAVGKTDSAAYRLTLQATVSHISCHPEHSPRMRVEPVIVEREALPGSGQWDGRGQSNSSWVTFPYQPGFILCIASDFTFWYVQGIGKLG